MSSTTTADSRTRTRIGEKFRDLAKRDARGLVIYLTAGDPNLEATRELLPALERAGADVIELGIPFSDPLADGPVIQRASERALKAGATLPKILAALPGWRRRTEVPLVLFSYYNPILQYGLKEFAADARKAGQDLVGFHIRDGCTQFADGIVELALGDKMKGILVLGLDGPTDKIQIGTPFLDRVIFFSRDPNKALHETC